MIAASIVRTTPYGVVVCCPYCDCFHIHSTSEVEAGGEIHAPCGGGDYIRGDEMMIRDLETAWRRRMADVRRKRVKKSPGHPGGGSPAA